ncbi:hypothetical protein H8D29_06580, partial [PVC group bacterium]|nr:hypothetical protein [PVC group bacterium]
LVGGFFNPILSIGFILLLPDSWNYTGAAVAYTLVFLIVNMIIMPNVTARKVKLTFGTIIAPIFKPLGIAIAVSPFLYVGNIFSDSDLLHWSGLIVGVATYGIAYSIASWLIMLSKRERAGIIRICRQAVGA